MNLKERLVSHGYDNIDILLIDEEKNQETVPGISLNKVTDLEYKLYLEPDSLKYDLDKDNPYFTARQKSEEGASKEVKGFILEW
ncbi:hypothetical protein [Halobacillus sp. Marseille-Q1614]|uniref:hypothetical protein n=1 Tax=Halobacillus sp. Marseille-Q1614 TaxID=2709134 RepID=UPI00157120DA|nr:hypothetical protein [Halobacillus sp. Marseille-Q1614]